MARNKLQSEWRIRGTSRTCLVHQLYFAKYRSGLSQTPRPTSILNCTTANRLIYNGVAPFEYEVVQWRMQGPGGAPVA